MPRPLIEKTLELNIMAELAYLGRLRRYKPYFIGFSQLDELSHGMDSAYHAGSLIGFFQFKRGYRRTSYYTFYINDNKPHYNQHEMLSDSNALTSACKYVFPLISTNAEVYKYRGCLLHWTLSLSPDLFSPLKPSRVRHRVRIYDDGTWIRYSDTSEIKEGTWTNVFGQLPKNVYFESEQTDYETIGRQRNWAQRAFDNLRLPNLDDTLRKMQLLETKMIFKQRSSFCMIFSKSES